MRGCAFGTCICLHLNFMDNTIVSEGGHFLESPVPSARHSLSQRSSSPGVRQVHFPGVQQDGFGSLAVDLLLVGVLEEAADDLPE